MTELQKGKFSELGIGISSLVLPIRPENTILDLAKLAKSANSGMFKIMPLEDSFLIMLENDNSIKFYKYFSCELELLESISIESPVSDFDVDKAMITLVDKSTVRVSNFFINAGQYNLIA